MRFSPIRIILVFGAALVLCAGFPGRGPGGRLHAAPLEKGIALEPSEARLRVLAAAGKYEHTPYRYGGLDKRGLDCSGLVYLSFQDALGVSVPRTAGSLYSWVDKIQIENALPGDLLFFKTTGNGNISHVGIFVGEGRFIHAASEGPKTGVIYSNLNERYWSLTYAGVGRALPEAAIGGGSTGNKNVTAAPPQKQKKEKTRESNNILVGFAFAPTWGAFFADGGPVRGAVGQFRLGAPVTVFGQPMIFGVELRPEWDGALGIFRIPLTLSWGINDKFRIFAGPALSFGDAALSVSGESRRYIGGTSWFGAAGITAAPFAFNVAGGKLAPYGELAWQSYFSNNTERNAGADLAAGFRFSTGLRYTWQK